MELNSFLNKIASLGLIEPYLYNHLQSPIVTSPATNRMAIRYLLDANNQIKLFLIADKYNEEDGGFSMRELAKLFEGSDDKYVQGAMNQLRGKFRENMEGYYGLVEYEHMTDDRFGLQRYSISPTLKLKMFIREFFNKTNDGNLTQYLKFLSLKGLTKDNLVDAANDHKIVLSDEYIEFFEFETNKGEAA